MSYEIKKEICVRKAVLLHTDVYTFDKSFRRHQNDDKFPCCVQATNGILTYNGFCSSFQGFR